MRGGSQPREIRGGGDEAAVVAGWRFDRFSKEMDARLTFWVQRNGGEQYTMSSNIAGSEEPL